MSLISKPHRCTRKHVVGRPTPGAGLQSPHAWLRRQACLLTLPYARAGGRGHLRRRGGRAGAGQRAARGRAAAAERARRRGGGLPAREGGCAGGVRAGVPAAGTAEAGLARPGGAGGCWRPRGCPAGQHHPSTRGRAEYHVDGLAPEARGTLNMHVGTALRYWLHGDRGRCRAAPALPHSVSQSL